MSGTPITGTEGINHHTLPATPFQWRCKATFVIWLPEVALSDMLWL